MIMNIIQRQITRKWYKIELFLQWQTNSKSYTVYRSAPCSMTLNDLGWLSIFLVHEPNGNLPTPNNPRTVDYFYCMYVLPVATPTKTTYFVMS